MKHETPHQHVAHAVSEGWVEGGSFLGSILSGALLGYLADMWLGTDPWLVVVGILVGSYSGFMNVWRWSKQIEEAGREH
jgi:ATP synthase protein I